MIDRDEVIANAIKTTEGRYRLVHTMHGIKEPFDAWFAREYPRQLEEARVRDREENKEWYALPWYKKAFAHVVTFFIYDVLILGSKREHDRASRRGR